MNNNIVFIKYTTKIPEGYALVPIDPTEKMTVAYYKLFDSNNAKEVFNAMVKAAPKVWKWNLN